MTCSSNTIFRPDRVISRLCSAAGAALLVLAGPLAAAAGDDAIAEAQAAVARGDGVAAEVAGKRALAKGAPRSAVSALIGEGELLQGDNADARQWLAPGNFDAATRQQGFRALSRLEMADGNLAAADAALAQAMQSGETALLLVDLGRLRYRMGNHQAAMQASARALELDPAEPRALEFAGQLARDQEGLKAALPFFDRGVRAAPDDAELALQYAATLGDAGENTGMLRVIRAVSENGGGKPLSFFLQAVLAARAGRDDVARTVWWQTDGAFDNVPAGLLVDGIIEYRSGNAAVAVDRLAELTRLQPTNDMARILLARALVANGEANVALRLLTPLAERADASPYVLVLTARAHEQRGERDLAAPLLDRVNAMTSPPGGMSPAMVMLDDGGRMARPDDLVQFLRDRMAQGQVAQAADTVRNVLGDLSGSVDLQFIGGDTALLAGDSIAAAFLFGTAGQVRNNWPLAQRQALILSAQNDETGARRLLANHLRNNPLDQPVALMLGRKLAVAGQRVRAEAVLSYAASLGSGPDDPFLLADLANLSGRQDHHQAAAYAQRAHALMRSNRRLAEVLGRIVQVEDGDTPAAAALLAKARR